MVQDEHAVVDVPSWSQVPLPHEVFAVAPPGQKVPAGQLAHCVLLVAVPAEVCSVPAEQVECESHPFWFVELVNVPAPHAVHARSLVAVPAVLTYVPAAHVVHAVQLAAFVVVLKFPLAHAAHVRSAVDEPELATYCPAGHVVFATQAVAELPSWSHSEALHAVFAVTPPGQ